MSEGSQEDVYPIPNMEPPGHTINKGGTEYHSEITETDKVLTFTGLDNYDALFAAKHGRGALDPVPIVSDQILTTPLGAPTPEAGPILTHPMEHMMSTQGGKEKDGLQIPPPSSAIIGEGAAVFTDMTETILDTLDRQAKTPTSTHLDKELLPQEEQKKDTKENTTGSYSNRSIPRFVSTC